MISTFSLMACAICHVWAVIQLLRATSSPARGLEGGFPSGGMVVVYMAAVCLFNWFAPGSGSAPYLWVALLSTTSHLVCALVQGAAAQALLRGAEDWLGYGVSLFALANLPMGGAQVIARTGSLVPWGSAIFFALNLAVVVLRAGGIPRRDGT